MVKEATERAPSFRLFGDRFSSFSLSLRKIIERECPQTRMVLAQEARDILANSQISFTDLCDVAERIIEITGARKSESDWFSTPIELEDGRSAIISVEDSQDNKNGGDPRTLAIKIKHMTPRKRNAMQKVQKYPFVFNEGLSVSSNTQDPIVSVGACLFLVRPELQAHPLNFETPMFSLLSGEHFMIDPSTPKCLPITWVTTKISKERLRQIEEFLLSKAVKSPIG